MNQFRPTLERYQSQINAFIDQFLRHQEGVQQGALKTLQRASRHALLNGGKRVRPMLVCMAAKAVDPDITEAIIRYPACAVEWLHSYSLVHDDLPSMDDDDLRRGQPTLHRAFDEATAILTGDGLQAQAFEILAATPDISDTQRIDMIATLAVAAGPKGMVGGQQIDILATDTDMTLDGLRYMHSLKTGALIRCSLSLGAIAAQANEAQRCALERYGEHIGLAFQVVDDILDVEGDVEKLGKTQGKDQAANKPTYVSLLGLEGAKAQARSTLEQALAAIEMFGESADDLRALARFIVERDR